MELVPMAERIQELPDCLPARIADLLIREASLANSNVSLNSRWGRLSAAIR